MRTTTWVKKIFLDPPITPYGAECADTIVENDIAAESAALR